MSGLSRKRIDCALIAVGLTLSIVAAGMMLSYEREGHVAGENSRALLVGLLKEMEAERLDVSKAALQTQAEGQMPQLVVDGHAAVGALRVESVGLYLPILESWSYDLLQVAPCRYSGTAEDGNLILLGHSYRDHFQPLKDAKVGDAVEFCDASGKTYLYEVAQTEILESSQLDELTGSSFDLTLFTCTFTGESRYVVRCEQVDDETA